MNFITFASLLGAFLGYFLLIKNRLQLDALQVPFVIFCGYVLGLYGFGLAGNLALGVTSIDAIGLLCLGIRLFYAKPTSNDIKDCMIASATLFATLCALYAWLPQQYLFTGWDEFSFWGSSIYTMQVTQHILTADSPSYFKHYPEGQQLFQFYYLSHVGWSERHVQIAQSLFVFSGLLFISKTFIKKTIPALGFSVLSVFFAYIFSYQLTNIYADFLLSVVFAAALCYAIKPHTQWRVHIPLLLFLGCLVTIKETGVLLSLIALGIYMGSQFLQPQSTFKTTSVVTALGVFIIFGVFFSWRHYVASIDAVRAIQIPPIHAFIEPPLTAKLANILQGFSKKLWDVIGFPILFFLILRKTRPSAPIKHNLLAINGLILLGYIAYVVFLIFSYWMFFSDDEAGKVSSFGRYWASYTFAWMMIIFALSANTISSKMPRMFWAGTITIIALFITLGNSKIRQDFSGFPMDTKVVNIRHTLSKTASIVKTTATRNDTIYFIHQSSDGIEHVVFHYLTLPANKPTKLSAPNAANCDELNDITKFKHNDLIVISHITDDCRTQWQKRFSIQITEPAVFKINTTATTEFTLTPISH